MPQFDYHSASVTVTNGGGIKKLLGANTNRVAVILSSSVAAPNSGNVSAQTGKDAQLSWAVTTTNTTVSFPYRDFGPLIREEWWVGTNTVNVTVTVTEIVKVG